MLITIGKVMERVLRVQMRQSRRGMQTNNEYVTVKDAAEMLGISPNTLRSWGASGAIVEYRHPVNNYRLYRRIDLEKLRKRLEQPQVSQPGIRP
jgi:DNA (cytosine-5)-methyltransferase 1